MRAHEMLDIDSALLATNERPTLPREAEHKGGRICAIDDNRLTSQA